MKKLSVPCVSAVLTVVMTTSMATSIATAQRGPSAAPNYDAFYEPGPDSLVRRGVPKGKVAGPFTLPSEVFPGVAHDYWVYVPAQYDGKTEVSLMVFNDDATYMQPDGWFYQNVRLKDALVAKGYDVNYAWGMGVHSHDMGGAMLPEMMRWLWRDHPVSVDPNNTIERSFRTGKPAVPSATPPPAANPAGAR
jgi:hypothetical protein